MAPKGKGKKAASKKACLRCPADTDDAVKCSHTLKCKSDSGDYSNLENLWPGYPSDPKSSFAHKTKQDSERLLEAAEANKKDYQWETITKQMLEQALKNCQDKGKTQKPAKSSTLPSRPKTEAPPTAAGSSKSAVATGTETESEAAHTLPEGSNLSSLQKLAQKERDDPFAKLKHNAFLGGSVTTPLIRPQMRLELAMPPPERPPHGGGPGIGDPRDHRVVWKGQLEQIAKQKEMLADCKETYALRPGFADTSQPGTMVRSNHFVVDLDPKKDFYEYEITGISDNASKGRKRDLVETMMLNCPVLRDQPDDYATDYKKKVIAWKDLFLWRAKEDPNQTRSITIPGNPDASGRSNDIVLCLKHIRTLSAQDLNEYVQGRRLSFANNGIIEALNILISKGVSEASAQSIEVGTNRYYYKPGHTSLTDGLVAIRGYFASIRPGMGNVLLNVNTVMGAFYEPIRVDQLLSKFRNDRRRADRFLKGVRVRIAYNRAIATDPKGKQAASKTSIAAAGGAQDESIDSERRRVKCIWSFGLPLDEQTFEKDGRKVFVIRYLRETYPQVRITNPKSLAVNVGNDARPSWFPAEHLNILPYQLYKMKLDPTQVAEMIRHACRDPDTNRMLIMQEGLPSIGITAELPRVLAQANMRISRQMIDVPGYSIQMPIIECIRRPDPRASSSRSQPQGSAAVKQSIKIAQSAAWGYHWEMTKHMPLKLNKRYRPQTFFIFVDEAQRRPEGAMILHIIVKEFNREIPPYGFGDLKLTIQGSMRLSSRGASPQGIEEGLKAARQMNADLVVLLLPSSGSQDAASYRCFKSLCDQVYGFKSICMAEDKLLKGGLQRAMQRHSPDGCLRYYFSGVALKLNLKLGNWNWEVSGDEIRRQLMRPANGRLETLVLGADVTHPSPASVQGTPSIAAVVGNADAQCGRMPGSLRRQTARNEMIEELDKMVEERLQDWNAEARSRHLQGECELPSRIIYYRDGVSESQYAAIKAIEIPQIKAGWDRARTKALARKTGNSIPDTVLITTVLVSKRHNTRFYPSPQNHPLRDQEGAGGPRPPKGRGNLKPGVVIESGVTSPYWHDFYLNSHFGLQGTVRPCHYIVLEDDNNMSALNLQRLTFLLCHMYQRATCSVSYATPTYYADRLCERGRHYLSEFFDGFADVRNKSEDVVRQMLDEAWFRGDSARVRSNPWHRNLDGTMFWL